MTESCQVSLGWGKTKVWYLSPLPRHLQHYVCNKRNLQCVNIFKYAEILSDNRVTMNGLVVLQRQIRVIRRKSLIEFLRRMLAYGIISRKDHVFFAFCSQIQRGFICDIQYIGTWHDCRNTKLSTAWIGYQSKVSILP